MWAQVCNNLWFIPGHSKMKIWQNAFNLYFDKRKKRRSLNYKRTPLRQLITSHWTFGQHSKCLQKIFKENRVPWITRAQACEPSALPLWAGRCPFCTTMQYFCSDFALLYFGPFFCWFTNTLTYSAKRTLTTKCWESWPSHINWVHDSRIFLLLVFDIFVRDFSDVYLIKEMIFQCVFMYLCCTPALHFPAPPLRSECRF